VILANGPSAATWATVTGILGTLATALASLGVALINTRKTSNVERAVNGQLTEFMERWEDEHDARLAVEVELAHLQEREKLRGN
jgi:hypothetical protein